MKKVIGYVVSIIGLVILTFGAGGFEIPLVGDMSTTLMNIFGIGFIIVGVIIIMLNSEKSSKKRKGKIKDLPVYEGEDIVAYRRD